jgi:hypothetical protein
VTSETELDLGRYIDRNVSAHSFERVSKVTEAALARDFGVIAAWKRKSWFRGNRAVVLASLPDSANHPGVFAQEIKMPVGKSIGYLPFFNELGLQLIISGYSILNQTRGLNKYVDKFSNQRVLIQSLRDGSLSCDIS